MKADILILSSYRKPLSFASIVCAVAFFSLFASQARATSYDAVTDFSSSTNTNTSTWSYRYQTSTMRNGIYPLLPLFAPAPGTWTPTNPSAWTTAPNTVPIIGVNQTGSDATFVPGQGSGPFVWPNNTMLMHPGPPGFDLSVLSWLSPASGFYNINFSFTDLDPNNQSGTSNGIAWFVDLNATDLTSGSFPNGGASGMMNLNNIFVNAGDRINFIVDPNGDFFYDSTQVTATITTVPDTGSTLVLLFVALTAIFGLKSLTFDPLSLNR